MNNNLVICIGRQFGSGGHEIGTGLAKALGVPCYDKEILKQAALESGIVQELFEKADEKASSGYLYNAAAGLATPSAAFASYSDYLTNDKLFAWQSASIKDLAAQGSCVMIGRCADYVLRGQHTLSIFVHAPLELRIQRIARMHNLEEDAARALIKKTDKSRANYYQFYTDSDWGAAETYDIALNCGKLGVEKGIDMLKQVVQSY